MMVLVLLQNVIHPQFPIAYNVQVVQHAWNVMMDQLSQQQISVYVVIQLIIRILMVFVNHVQIFMEHNALLAINKNAYHAFQSTMLKMEIAWKLQWIIVNQWLWMEYAIYANKKVEIRKLSLMGQQ